MSQQMPFENFRVLVIEDNPDCLRQAHKFFDSLVLPFQIHVSYARTLHEALPLLSQVDGVICDLFFPTHNVGDDIGANCERVIEQCLEVQIPLILVENGRYPEQDVPREVRFQISGLRLINRIFVPFIFLWEDADAEESAQWTKHSKPWEQAFYGLLYQLHGLSQGAFQMIRNGVNKLKRPIYEGEFEDRWHDRPVLEDWREAHSNLSTLNQWTWIFVQALHGKPVERIYFYEDILTRELRDIVVGTTYCYP